MMEEKQAEDCLLYTSDAADERSSVDLGGRRIIKKKKCQYDVVESRLTNSAYDYTTAMHTQLYEDYPKRN